MSREQFVPLFSAAVVAAAVAGTTAIATLEHRPISRVGEVILADARLDTSDLQRIVSASGRTLPLPPPTINWLAPDALAGKKKARKAWMKQMRKGPLGDDWKAIERDNGLHQTARRNAMVGAPPPSPTEAEWMERGSNNQAGRMMVARLSADGERLYAGSSLGGVWRGNPDGSDWEPLGDNLYGGAHWLELTEDGSGGERILAATDGGLIHHSDDDGVTWSEPTGLPELSAIRRMVQSTAGDDEIYLLGYDGSYALYRSDDGGQTWDELTDLGSFAGDAWVPRDGTEAMYLATSEGIQRSTDQGDSWTLMGALPTSMSRAELAGSQAGGPTLWMGANGTDLYRSNDGGASWTWTHSFEDYWGVLQTSIDDPNVVVYGGVDAYRTANGQDFSAINYWWEYYADPENLLHADNMGIDVLLDADGQETWYINTDGGTYVSTDAAASVWNLSTDGLRVSQYYDVLTDSENPDYVAAGAQDQGYQMTGGVTQDDDILDFDQIISGDYAHLTSGDGTHDLVFSVYPGFTLVQEGGEDPDLTYLDFPENESYSWLPPIVADPYDRQDFFFCATRLYKFSRAGFTWKATLWSDQDFDSNGYEYLSGLVFSPVDPERAYASTNYGRVFYSDDHGVTWTESYSRVAYPQYLSGNALAASLTDIDTVTIGGSGYGVPSVYRSTDGGETFSDWSDGIDDTLVYSLAEAPDGSGTILAGTQTTVYRRDPGDAEWTDVSDSTAPITIYWSAEALQHENTIRFGTYGRGIWDYRLDPEHEGCFPVQDFDGDGVLCDEDCDDHDADISPDAEEVCGNDTDEDCDGVAQDCDDGTGDDGSDDGSGDEGSDDGSGDEGSDDGSGDEGASSDDDGGGSGGGGGEDPKDCGCATPATTPLALLWLTGLVAVRRRR